MPSQYLITTRGEKHIGLAACGTKVDDIVVVVLGCPLPMVLRLNPTERYQVVGSAYIHQPSLIMCSYRIPLTLISLSIPTLMTTTTTWPALFQTMSMGHARIRACAANTPLHYGSNVLIMRTRSLVRELGRLEKVSANLSSSHRKHNDHKHCTHREISFARFLLS